MCSNWNLTPFTCIIRMLVIMSIAVTVLMLLSEQVITSFVNIDSNFLVTLISLTNHEARNSHSQRHQSMPTWSSSSTWGCRRTWARSSTSPRSPRASTPLEEPPPTWACRESRWRASPQPLLDIWKSNSCEELARLHAEYWHIFLVGAVKYSNFIFRKDVHNCFVPYREFCNQLILTFTSTLCTSAAFFLRPRVPTLRWIVNDEKEQKRNVYPSSWRLEWCRSCTFSQKDPSEIRGRAHTT